MLYFKKNEEISGCKDPITPKSGKQQSISHKIKTAQVVF